MCMICVDYQKQLLTYAEAWANLGEMEIDREHRVEVGLMLEKDKMERLKKSGALPKK